MLTTKINLFVLMITGFSLILFSLIGGFSTLKPMDDDSQIFKVHAQRDSISGLSVPANKTISSNNSSESPDQKLLQLQTKVSELQSQYNQIINKTNNLEKLISQIQDANLVTASDLGALQNQINQDLSGELGILYEIINDMQSTISGLQSGVNYMASLDEFDNCVLYAADYGSQTDLLGFSEALKSCTGRY